VSATKQTLPAEYQPVGVTVTERLPPLMLTGTQTVSAAHSDSVCGSGQVIEAAAPMTTLKVSRQVSAPQSSEATT